MGIAFSYLWGCDQLNLVHSVVQQGSMLIIIVLWNYIIVRYMISNIKFIVYLVIGPIS